MGCGGEAGAVGKCWQGWQGRQRRQSDTELRPLCVCIVGAVHAGRVLGGSWLDCGNYQRPERKVKTENSAGYANRSRYG